MSDPESAPRPSNRTLTLPALALVAAGGFVGALARYGIDLALGDQTAWPTATLTVNLLGAAVLGLLLEWTTYASPSGAVKRVRLFFGTGLLGAFTTYSALAVGLEGMLRGGLWLNAAGYLLVTLVGGGICSAAGILLGQALRRRRERRSAARPNPGGES